MTTPLFKDHLPEIWTLIHRLGEAFAADKLTAQQFDQVVRAFFTPRRMQQTERVVPGWGQMASYGNGVTMVHVITVLTSLMLSPSYRALSPHDRNLLLWIGIFHDIEKKVINREKDHTHGFRSAAVIGRQAPQLGFDLRRPRYLDAWAKITRTATTYDPIIDRPIQDNEKLPRIMAGIRDVFGTDTPAALVTSAVLLHMSINVVHAWPQSAPLPDAEIPRYVDAALLPLLRTMMIADNDAWAFFDEGLKQSQRAETEAVFRRIERMIAKSP